MRRCRCLWSISLPPAVRRNSWDKEVFAFKKAWRSLPLEVCICNTLCCPCFTLVTNCNSKNSSALAVIWKVSEGSRSHDLIRTSAKATALSRYQNMANPQQAIDNLHNTDSYAILCGSACVEAQVGTCVWVCMRACMHACIRVRLVHIFVHTWRRACVRMHANVHACMCV